MKQKNTLKNFKSQKDLSIKYLNLDMVFMTLMNEITRKQAVEIKVQGEHLGKQNLLDTHKLEIDGVIENISSSKEQYAKC